MKHQWKFYLIGIIGIVSLILNFSFNPIIALNLPLAAWLINLFGIGLTWTLVKEMLDTLKQGNWGVDLLAIIAVISTIIVGDYWATWMILIMLTGGETLEAYATGQADKDLRSLIQNSPQVAHQLVAGKLHEVSVEELTPGDVVLIRPGDLVPVDGVIIKGASDFDQSSLTGESLPSNHGVGDTLMSGSINGETAVEMKVTKHAQDSEYQSIVRLVKSAEAQPANFVKLADRYAVPFTIISLIIGLAATGSSLWFNPQADWQVHFMRFAQVMVVASPCPLLIAAPVAFVSGMSAISRHHVIVKSGPTLEKLAQAKTFAFDKTGTLTQNRLVIDQVVSNGHYDTATLQQLAASAEQHSSHIIAASLVQATDSLLAVSALTESTGNGVSGIVVGKHVMVGKRDYVSAIPITPADSTAIYITIDGHYEGYITFKDQMRVETPSTLARLRRQGVEHLMMLTGDQPAVAEQIGRAAGVDDIRANLLPGEKIAAIKAVPAAKRPVVMVGDGVNDAPSLTAADVGIAMGASGATAASESADAVVMVNDLAKISDAVAVAKHTLQVVKVDVLTAITIVILIEYVAFTGIIPAFWGAILQEVVDLITISLALLAKKAPKNPAHTGLPVTA